MPMYPPRSDAMARLATRRRWCSLAAAALLSFALPVHADSAERARAAVEAYLSWWIADGHAEAADLFADDLRLRSAQTHPQRGDTVVGLGAVQAHVRAAAQRKGPWRFADLHVFPTLQGHVHVAQFAASTPPAQGGRACTRTMILRIETDGMRVVRLVEFGNPATERVDAAPTCRAPG
jgi:hypothetical protein